MLEVDQNCDFSEQNVLERLLAICGLDQHDSCSSVIIGYQAPRGCSCHDLLFTRSDRAEHDVMNRRAEGPSGRKLRPHWECLLKGHPRRVDKGELYRPALQVRLHSPSTLLPGVF